ncbi:gephyrin-like molybdotransferase Glp [Catenovulum sp. SX2]|uniref:molybdopterin molybdotransferase MoeA n=1 Tax=Catenovulum sp. SX2 TaxID=3398614 RepID=UPI003F87C001
MNCDNDIFITVDQALTRMANAVRPIKQTETVCLQDALGRVLAETICSPINVPAYDNSAMDGYALNLSAKSANSRYKVVSQILAGKPNDTEIKAGECARIMTGGKIPVGCDAVIMQENVRLVDDNCIELTKGVKLGDNIRRSGDDISQGETIFAIGRKLSAIDIGCLASLGLKHIQVIKQLTIGIFTTGDELAQPGEPLKTGQIYDSNRPMLKALLKQAGFDVLDAGVIADELEAIKTGIKKLAAVCDAIITCGGVSVGVADYTGKAFAELGEIDFWKVAMKPGKPFAFGSIKHQQNTVFLFGLPGNPVSSAVTFEILTLPILRLMSSQQAQPTNTLYLPTNKAIKKRPGRRDYQRASIQRNEQGTPIAVTPFAKQSSGVLSELAHADCLIVLEKEQDGVEQGESVLVLPVAK